MMMKIPPRKYFLLNYKHNARAWKLIWYFSFAIFAILFLQKKDKRLKKEFNLESFRSTIFIVFIFLMKNTMKMIYYVSVLRLKLQKVNFEVWILCWV